MNEGAEKEQRATLDDGTCLRVRSVFGHQMRFDLAQGFPLVTVKRVPFSVIVAELLWFLSGSTNKNVASERGARIWNQWGDSETGELGPIYGKQWRGWESINGEKVDQIEKIVRGIREVSRDPRSPCARRLIVSAWNPGDQNFPGLRPAPFACHTLWQCNVTDGVLSTHLYQRSGDVFLGVPFNIASYALLTHMLAQVTGLRAGYLIHSFGDAHIYENHFEQVATMLTREPYPLPRLHLDSRIQEIDAFRACHVNIADYVHHPPLPGDVAV